MEVAPVGTDNKDGIQLQPAYVQLFKDSEGRLFAASLTRVRIRRHVQRLAVYLMTRAVTLVKFGAEGRGNLASRRVCPILLPCCPLLFL